MPTETPAAVEPASAPEEAAPAAVEEQAPPADTAQFEAPIEGEEALGDPGKKALDAMKAKWKSEADARKAAEREVERMKAATEGREAEWKAQREAEDREAQKFAERYRNAEVKAAAKGKVDPDLALKLLDLEAIEVSEDGTVDAAAIDAALDGLLAKYPNLAVQDGRRFTGTPDAGARNAELQGQLTKDQLSSMTPEQINAARRAGRLNNVLGIS